MALCCSEEHGSIHLGSDAPQHSCGGAYLRGPPNIAPIRALITRAKNRNSSSMAKVLPEVFTKLPSRPGANQDPITTTQPKSSIVLVTASRRDFGLTVFVVVLKGLRIVLVEERWKISAVGEGGALSVD